MKVYNRLTLLLLRTENCRKKSFFLSGFVKNLRNIGFHVCVRLWSLYLVTSSKNADPNKNLFKFFESTYDRVNN